MNVLGPQRRAKTLHVEMALETIHALHALYPTDQTAAHLQSHGA